MKKREKVEVEDVVGVTGEGVVVELGEVCDSIQVM